MGYYVMGKHTSVAWYSTQEEAIAECNRMNVQGGTCYHVEGERMTIGEFARLVEREQREEYLKRHSEFTTEERMDHACSVSVKPGKKYVKVDVGSSGRFMIDHDGNIFGIKGYGVIHKGHHYGTLDTTHEWNWGSYYPKRKESK